MLHGEMSSIKTQADRATHRPVLKTSETWAACVAAAGSEFGRRAPRTLRFEPICGTRFGPEDAQRARSSTSFGPREAPAEAQRDEISTSTRAPVAQSDEIGPREAPAETQRDEILIPTPRWMFAR